MFKRLVIVTLALGLLSAALAPFAFEANAQDGLTDEQIALVDRVLELSDKQDEYTSFTQFTEESEEVSFDIAMMGQSLTNANLVNRTIEATVVQSGEDEDGEPIYNAAGTVNVTVSTSDVRPGQDAEEMTYTLEADVRWIDETLYVNGTYADMMGDVPELPEGWVAVDDFEMYPAFEELGLDDLLEDDEDSPDIFDDRDVLLDSVGDVTSEMTTLEDGTEVEMITLSFTAENFGELMDRVGTMDEDNEDARMFFDAIGSNFTYTLSVAVDGDGNLRMTGFSMSATVTDGDLGEMMDDAPEGATFGLTMNMSRTDYYNDINADLEMPTMPEGME